jgi:uncharacterized Zn-binding protein involved in type VI secretion
MSNGQGGQAPPFSMDRLQADASNAIDQMIGSPGQRGETGVTGRWFKSAKDNVAAWGKLNDKVVNPITGAERDPTGGEVAARVLRNVSNSVGTLLSTLQLPMDMINMGFATLTSSLAQAYGAQPASTIMELYISTPHFHAPPVAGPVPLPAIGMVVLGVHLKTLINYMPAARVGDYGFSPTCGSKTPWFEIFLGSSNVFIGGKRAARVGDIAICCKPGGGPLAGFQKFMAIAGMVAGGLAIAADIAEAAVEDDAAMAAAKAMSAAMNSAQMAMDAAALAVGMIPKDPGAPPGIGPLIIGPSSSTGKVLIGGFPMINIPDPVEAIFNKLKTLRARKNKPQDDGAGAPDN